MTLELTLCSVSCVADRGQATLIPGLCRAIYLVKHHIELKVFEFVWDVDVLIFLV